MYEPRYLGQRLDVFVFLRELEILVLTDVRLQTFKTLRSLASLTPNAILEKNFNRVKRARLTELKAPRGFEKLFVTFQTQN